MRRPPCRTVWNWSLFLGRQPCGNERVTPEDRIPPEVDSDSSKYTAKSESWNNPNLQCCAVFPTWQYCLKLLVPWIYEIKRAKRLWQAPFTFVTACSSLFTNHRMSGLPMRANYRHFRTIWEQTHGVETSTIARLFFNAFLCMFLHVVGPCNNVCTIFVQLR